MKGTLARLFAASLLCAVACASQKNREASTGSATDKRISPPQEDVDRPLEVAPLPYMTNGKSGDIVNMMKPGDSAVGTLKETSGDRVLLNVTPCDDNETIAVFRDPYDIQDVENKRCRGKEQDLIKVSQK